MLIRRLVIASLVAGAASAQAGTIPSSATQPTNVVSGWTTGNGTDVLGSGVLQGNLNLVAGVAHTANASLSDILYGKVAGSVQQVEGQTKLFFQRGIEANYLLASGHGILAATAGLGKSVVGSADGAIISNGLTKAPSMSGGGNLSSSNNSTSNGSTSNNSSTSTNSGNSAPSATTGSTSSGNTSTPTSTPSASQGNNSNGNNSGVIPADTGLGNGALNGKGDGIGTGKGGGLGNIANQEAQAAEVPEPSSIALMLLGMMGAGAISRRRSR